MKTIAIATLFSFFTHLAMSQNDVQNLTEIQVNPPKFMGSYSNTNVKYVDIYNYVAQNFVYPKQQLVSYEGTFIVTFAVSKSGELVNFVIGNSIHPEIDRALIETLKSSGGMWKPGYKNGEIAEMEQTLKLAICANKYDGKEMQKHFKDVTKYYYEKAGRQLFVKHNPKKALKRYDICTRYMPNDHAVLMARGMCLFELGNIKAARNAWGQIKNFDKNGIVPIEFGLFQQFSGYAEMLAILH